MRRALYQSRRFDLGCPKDGFCSLFRRLQQERECSAENGCKNFLGPVEELPASWALRRLAFLSRLESLVNVGCKFAPNDLEPSTWSELVMLALERQRIEELIRKGKDRQAQKDRPPPEAEAALRSSRKELGLPESGTSLFPQKRPMR